MLKNKLFSYLAIKNYLLVLSKFGFESFLIYFKISTRAIFLLREMSTNQ